MLWAMVMVVGPKNKEKIVEGDQCNSTKDPPTIKSVFSLKYKDVK